MSNGALMRITPIAIYTCKLSAENAREVIDADVLLTHPSKACCDIIYMYCSSIHFLINNAQAREHPLCHLGNRRRMEECHIQTLQSHEGDMGIGCVGRWGDAR